MDLTISPISILQRSLQIIFSPHRCWKKLNNEDVDWKQILFTYFIPLSIFSFFIHFIELSIIGVPTVVGRITTPFISALAYCIASTLVIPLFVILIARCAVIVTEKVKQPNSFENCCKLLLLAFTPNFYIPVFSYLPLSEELSSITMLYSVYLAGYGSKEYLRLTRENRILFGIGILASAILLTIVFGLLFGSLMPQPTL
jgi:hypothetical protein